VQEDQSREGGAAAAGGTILLIEDHYMYRQIICAMIGDKMGLEVAGAAATGVEGLELYAARKPDLVLLDLDLPDMGGFEVADKMVAADPTQRILAVSSQCNEFTLYRVLRSGLFGFVNKLEQGLDSLEFAIRENLAWRPYYAAVVHQVLLSQHADPKAFSKVLTEREQELMCLFGVGMRNEDIAERLNISPQTVQGHRRNIMQKLGVTSATGLIRYALKKGFARVSEI